MFLSTLSPAGVSGNKDPDADAGSHPHLIGKAQHRQPRVLLPVSEAHVSQFKGES